MIDHEDPWLIKRESWSIMDFPNAYRLKNQVIAWSIMEDSMIDQGLMINHEQGHDQSMNP